MGFSLVAWGLGVLAAGSVSAQYVISVHSGVVHYVEGAAFLNDQPVDPQFGHFTDIKENQEFRTEQGRAEILLTPGVFLRLGENSSIRMISTRLTDTRVEILKGSAIVECNDVPKDNAVQLVYKSDTILLAKQGLYRLDTEPTRFRVYNGEAIVKDEAGEITVKNGKETSLGALLTAENFDRNDQDELYRWSDRRAGYVAQANVASASSTGGGGYGYGYSGLGYSGLGYGGLGYGGLGYGYGGYGFLGGWMFNPMFGMYTWLPYSGFGYSPFGYTYFSPYTVAYAPYYGGSSSGSGYPLRSRTSGNTYSPTSRTGSTASLGHTPVSGGFGGARSSARAGGFGGGHMGGFSSGGHASGGGHGR